MMYPLVRDLAGQDARVRVPVAVTCRVLGFSRQAFYAWCKNPVSDRDWEEAHLINAAYDAHAADPQYGYRFITDELLEQGFTVSERRIWRICSVNKIWSVFGKGKTGKPRPGPPAHDDLLQRVFTAQAPNQVWVTDITEHPTGEGKLYVCTVKDLCGKKIVGYSMGARMKASLAVAALNNAVSNRAREDRNVTGCIVHSDRGSQFRAKSFLRALEHHRLKGSMGQVGACADNAAAESFFSLLQKNVLNRQYWQTRQHLREEISYWIEVKYHRRRRQRELGKLTPIEYEMIHQQTAQAA